MRNLKLKSSGRRDLAVRHRGNWIGTAELTIQYLHMGLDSPFWIRAVFGLANPLVISVEAGCGRKWQNCGLWLKARQERCIYSVTSTVCLFLSLVQFVLSESPISPENPFGVVSIATVRLSDYSHPTYNFGVSFRDFRILPLGGLPDATVHCALPSCRRGKCEQPLTTLYCTSGVAITDSSISITDHLSLKWYT